MVIQFGLEKGSGNEPRSIYSNFQSQNVKIKALMNKNITKIPIGSAEYQFF